MAGTVRRARALVVGVEQYQGGSAWTLDGPAHDALGYVRWLLEVGLPPDRITLLLSPLDRNADAVRSIGLRHRPSDRATVHDVLFRELPTDQGDFLLVVWSGHGLLDTDGRRRLLYEDAAPDDIRCLDLDAALAAYRSDLVASFPSQLWLIDACQTYADPARVRGALRSDPVPAGRPRPRPGQYALFACGPGEAARNEATARIGTFSTAALKELRGAPREGVPPDWPPDPASLTAALSGIFQELRRAGRAHQTPSYFWHSGPEGTSERWTEGTPVATTPARTLRIALQLKKQLVSALENVPSMADPDSRAVVFTQLPAEILSSLPRSAVPRLQLLNLIDICAAFPDGLVRLREAIGLADSGTGALQDLDRVLGAIPGYPDELDGPVAGPS
ncbi:effector-associated domain 2-containing protein [Streptomyces sp. T028]|uniref:effector-associated domain 2-containing protein n=1 Tax=Streptomyces sp. T028 TaxID=3394379 RepID=UPI003A8A8EBD